MRYADTCPHCGETFEGDSLMPLAAKMWVHEAKHPQGVPDLETIKQRIKSVPERREEERTLLR